MSERIAIPKLSGNGIVVREVKGDITINPITFIIDDLNDNYSIVSRANGVEVSKELLDVQPDTIIEQNARNVGIKVEPNEHVLYYGHSLIINKEGTLAYIGTLREIDYERLRNSDDVWKDSMYFHCSDDEQMEEARLLICSNDKHCLIGRLESLKYPTLYLYIYS